MTSWSAMPASRAGHVARRVAEVGVEVEEQVVAVLDGEAHGREDGRAQAELAGAVDDVDPRVGGGQLVGERAGAVGRVVVDDQDVGVRAGARGSRRRAGRGCRARCRWPARPASGPVGRTARRLDQARRAGRESAVAPAAAPCITVPSLSKGTAARPTFRRGALPEGLPPWPRNTHNLPRLSTPDDGAGIGPRQEGRAARAATASSAVPAGRQPVRSAATPEARPSRPPEPPPRRPKNGQEALRRDTRSTSPRGARTAPRSWTRRSPRSACTAATTWSRRPRRRASRRYDRTGGDWFKWLAPGVLACRHVRGHRAVSSITTTILPRRTC